MGASSCSSSSWNKSYKDFKKYLCSLPSALAIKPSFKLRYDFDNFELDVEWLEDVGIVGADSDNRSSKPDSVCVHMVVLSLRSEAGQ